MSEGPSDMSIFCNVDDKSIPLYRIMWIASTPHFCGEEDCTREGYYEVRLERGEAVWANPDERDAVLEKIENWHTGIEGPDGEEW